MSYLHVFDAFIKIFSLTNARSALRQVLLISGYSVVKCSRFYCYFNLEMITKYLKELYNLFSALMLPAQGPKRECCVNKI